MVELYVEGDHEDYYLARFNSQLLHDLVLEHLGRGERSEILVGLRFGKPLPGKSFSPYGLERGFEATSSKDVNVPACLEQVLNMIIAFADTTHRHNVLIGNLQFTSVGRNYKVSLTAHSLI